MRFQLNRQHVLAALDLTVNSAYAVQAFMIQGMIFVFTLAFYHDSPDKVFRMLFVATVIFILFFLPKYLFARHHFIKIFTVLPEFTEPIDIEIVNDELVIKMERSSSALPRAWINKVKSNDQVTVLYRESVPCFIIPAEVMKADERLRKYVENNPVQTS